MQRAGVIKVTLGMLAPDSARMPHRIFSVTRHNVLVVDDDDAIRALVTRVLQRHQYAVEQACNGEEAMDKLRQAKFDVVLLDLMMPIMSGFDVIDRLAIESPDQPVVVMSAASDRDFQRVSNAPVVQSIIRKPFELSDLLEAVRRSANGEPGLPR